MTEEKRGRTEKNRKKRLNRQQKTLILLITDVVLLLAILVTGGMLAARWYRDKNRPDLSKLVAPDWYTQDFLQRNPYSRPGIKRSEINDIVVHYVANPGTSAVQNRNYFNNLAEQTGEKPVSASSHYIIGIDGEIIQCIPLD